MDSFTHLIQQRIQAFSEELEELQSLADQLPEPYRSEVKADLIRLRIN